MILRTLIVRRILLRSIISEGCTLHSLIKFSSRLMKGMQVYVYWLTMSWSIFHRIDCEHNKNMVREIVKEVGCAKFTRKHIESKDQN